MRNQQSRVCASSWDLEAKLGQKDTALKAWVQSTVSQAPKGLFSNTPAVPREPGSNLLKVDIIANFAPQLQSSAVLTEEDVEGLIEMLRRINRDPHIGEYSIVACSLQAQKVFHRQINASSLDFPAMGEALQSLNLGVVDAKTLAVKNGPAEFIAKLFAEEAHNSVADALIIVGAKPNWEVKMPKEVLESIENVGRPVFYLDYNLHPEENSWRDFVGKVVKQKHGVEYSVSHPKEFFYAWSDIVSRMVKMKHLDEQKPDGRVWPLWK